MDGRNEGDTYRGWNSYYPGSSCDRDCGNDGDTRNPSHYLNRYPNDPSPICTGNYGNGKPRVEGHNNLWTATTAQWYELCSEPGSNCGRFSQCTAPPSGVCINAPRSEDVYRTDRKFGIPGVSSLLETAEVSAKTGTDILEETTSGSSAIRNVLYDFIGLPTDLSRPQTDDYEALINSNVEVEFEFYYRNSKSGVDNVADSNDFDNSTDVVTVPYSRISSGGGSYTVTVPMTIKNNKIGSRPVIEPDEKIIVNPRIIISKRGSNHVYERFESPRLGDITLTIDDVFNSHRYSLVSTQAVGSEGVIVRIRQ